MSNKRDFDEADEYCPNCDNHFVIDAETKKSKAVNEGKAGVVVGVQGESEREVQELRDAMMRKMMEEGIDEDLLDDLSVCWRKKKKRNQKIENRKEENSEAGNRTPVVRVTGGNTKPLYYFGSAIEFKVSPIKIRLNIPIFLQMSSRIKNNFSQKNYCHMCMSTDKLSIMCDNVVECKSSVSYM